jgi:hypothetical protein
VRSLVDALTNWPTTGVVVTPQYFVKDVIYHLELRRADEMLCKKFSEIACDDNKEILIPMSTMHYHQHSLFEQPRPELGPNS